MAKKKKKSSFRGKVKADAKRQKAAGSNYGYLILPKGINMYKPNPGDREEFDVIPYTVSNENHPDKDAEMSIALVDDLWYKRPFKVHKEVGADNDTVVCLSTFGKKCPICEHKKQRAKDGADQDELKGFTAKQRILYVVIPRGIKKVEEDLHIFDMSPYLFQHLLNEELGENEDNEIFPDLEEGKTLKVRWEEKSFGKTTFADANRIDFMDRDEEIDEDIIKNVPDLDVMLQELSYDEIHAKFFELDSEESADEEEDENPKKSRKKKTTKKKKEKEEKELTWEDITDMADSELSEVIDEKDLDLDVEDFDDTQDLQEAVAKELGVDVPKKKSPKKPAKKKEDKKTKKSKNKCPHGLKFGVDVDTNDACENCDLWDDCFDKSEED